MVARKALVVIAHARVRSNAFSCKGLAPISGPVRFLCIAHLVRWLYHARKLPRPRFHGLLGPSLRWLRADSTEPGNCHVIRSLVRVPMSPQDALRSKNNNLGVANRTSADASCQFQTPRPGPCIECSCSHL